jgi:hypothetical protein
MSPPPHSPKNKIHKISILQNKNPKKCRLRYIRKMTNLSAQIKRDFACTRAPQTESEREERCTKSQAMRAVAAQRTHSLVAELSLSSHSLNRRRTGGRASGRTGRTDGPWGS